MSALPLDGDLFDGKYRVGRLLGTGGMAAVLAATHLGLDERVALKILLPECCDDPAVVERFVQEGKTATKLRGEHVVRMIDVGIALGHAYLVMEYLDGKDLGVLLREGGPLPLATAVDLLLQAAEAVGEGHVLGIIHRDLKPANLFLTHRVDGSPCVKVLDFGISKRPPSAGVAFQPTLPSVVMGSPQYMSPEQMTSSASVDPRSDLWSLGTILYELLTGDIAFDGSTTTEVCARVLQGAPVPLLQVRSDVPREVGLIIARCLEKEPSRRYGNVAELARALAPFGGPGARASATSLGRIVEGAVVDVEPDTRSPLGNGIGTIKPTAAEILSMPPPRRPRTTGYIVASILALLALGGFALRAGSLRTFLPTVAAAQAASTAIPVPLLASPAAPLSATALPLPTATVPLPPCGTRHAPTASPPLIPPSAAIPTAATSASVPTLQLTSTRSETSAKRRARRDEKVRR